MSSQLPNYRWIKFGLDHLNDPAFMQLADATAGVYLKFYLLAGRADAGGLLCSGLNVYSLKDLAWQLRMPSEILRVAIDELMEAGFVSVEKDGYWLPRFLDEQGPGDNAQRDAWVERQRRHRQKTAPLKEKKRFRKDKEGESHGDVTVTKEPTPTLDIFEEQLLEKIGEKVDIHRLEACISVWQSLSERNGWRFKNVEAVLELYTPDGLEERIRREKTKIQKAAKSTWGGGYPNTETKETEFSQEEHADLRRVIENRAKRFNTLNSNP